MDPASNHFILSGAGTCISFQDYRFIMRARLNLLPTRTVLKRIKQVNDDLCLRYHTHPKTLAHVLNHCPASKGLRHNRVLRRLVEELPEDSSHIYTGQKPLDSPIMLRPDVLVIGRESAVIVDIAVPFEGTGSLQEARHTKIIKYSMLWLTGCKR